MNCTKQELTQLLEQIAPIALAEEWDNVGWLLDNGATHVQKILLAFDVTPFSADFAIQNGCDCIISHHPLLFKPIKRIDAQTMQGQTLLKLIRAGVCVYSAHTNLDAAPGGVNDCLAAKLGLTDVAGQALVRTGNLPHSMPLHVLVRRVAQALHSQQVHFVGDAQRAVRTVAVCGGSGMSVLGEVKGCDVLITGELKYDQALAADAQNQAIIVAGHYETEAFVMQFLLETLQERFYRVECKIDVLMCHPHKVVHTL